MWIVVMEIWSNVVAKNHETKLILGDKFVFVYDSKAIEVQITKKLYEQTDAHKNASKTYNWHGTIAVE